MAVNRGLLERHRDGFDLFAEDVARQGWEVSLTAVEGGTPLDLKNAVIREGGEEIRGVIFAGELPLAWFEQLEYFDDQEEPDNQLVSEYPVDLFFTDLDGEWTDSDTNGIYDAIDENWAPEIWLGRLAAYNLSRLDEDSLIAAYLDRRHAYVTGELRLPHRAKTFIDDDWISWADQWSDAAGEAFGRVLTTSDPEATSATVYRDELTSGYELMHVAVHSTADAHAFLINDRGDYDYFRFRNLRDSVEPNVFFYNLFACSNLNLSGNLCMGALYIMKQPFGLGAVGTAKVGGMLYNEDFYGVLGEGVCFGEALKRWMIQHGREPEHERWAQSWFNGMTYFGDPTLRIRLGLTAVDHRFAEDSSLSADGLLDAGDEGRLSLIVRNRARNDVGDVSARLVALDTMLFVEDGDVSGGALASGEDGVLADWRIRVHPAAPDRATSRLEAQMTTDDGEVWWSRILLNVSAPMVELSDFFYEPVDSALAFAGPGDEGEMRVSLCNVGGDAVPAGATLQFVSLDSLIQFSDALPGHPEIPPDGSISGEIVGYTVTDDAPRNGVAYVLGRSLVHGVLRGEWTAALPISEESSYNLPIRDGAAWALHRPVTPGYADVWRWDGSAGDDGGALSFGGPDSTDYPAMSDGAIYLPAGRLDEGSILILRHKLDAEPAYDAAVVEQFIEGEWIRLAPRGGYPGAGVDNGSFEGGECWNGSFDWRTDSLDLQGESGAKILRLRFASDHGVEGDGWRISQIGIEGIILGVAGESSPPRDPTLVSIFPNPSNSSFSIKIQGRFPEKIALVDPAGRRVVELSIPGGMANAPNSSEILHLPVGELAVGIYFLRWEGGGGSGGMKIALLK